MPELPSSTKPQRNKGSPLIHDGSKKNAMAFLASPRKPRKLLLVIQHEQDEFYSEAHMNERTSTKKMRE